MFLRSWLAASLDEGGGGGGGFGVEGLMTKLHVLCCGRWSGPCRVPSCATMQLSVLM